MKDAVPTDLQLFFLPGSKGQLFCVLHCPVYPERARGAILFVHAFAEEMNKSRRMVALQARALSAEGWFVLIVDLYGCGDSEGLLEEATWETWLVDLERCTSWLIERTGLPVTLWGMRFGALLVMDLWQRLDGESCPRVLLWQPLVHGSAVLKTLLRQRLVAELDTESAQEGGSKELKARLAAGETLELSGYVVTSDLARSLNGASLERCELACGQIDWIDVTRTESSPVPPLGAKLRQAWAERGLTVEHRNVVCEPFWAAAEILECPALIEATTTALR